MNNNDDNGQGDDNSQGDFGKMLRDMIAAATGGLPPRFHGQVRDAARSSMSDLSDDYGLLLAEVLASPDLLTPAIGYLGKVTMEVELAAAKLLDAKENGDTMQYVAPSVVGWEDGGAGAPGMVELADLGLVAVAMAARRLVAERARKLCCVAEMISTLGKGNGPSAESASAMRDSMARIERLLRASGISVDLSKFDLSKACDQIEAYIQRIR
jgi:hypothetical protein